MADKYVLFNENRQLSVAIQSPIKQTKRIKYSCFDASEKFLVFGATSGSLYIFQREPCLFIKIIPSKLQSVSQVKISRHEKLIAFSNVKGQIGIVDLLAAPESGQVNVAQLEKSYVTAFYWDNDEKLYCGDQKGNVSAINLGYFMGRNISNVTLKSILLLDSPVVQIQGHRELLLISTYSKCVLCNTDLDEYKQIGNKPRDGEYGALFHTITDDFGTLTRIYCARPGCRLWEVDLDGDIKYTHQFKSALSAPPAKPMSPLDTTSKSNVQNGNKNTDLESASPSNTFHFAKLINFMDKFVITYSDSKFYVIDPTSRVVLWTNHFSNIQSVCAVRSSIIVFTSVSTLFTVECAPLQEYVLRQFQNGLYVECAGLIKANAEYFGSIVKKQREYHQLYKLKQCLEDRNQTQLALDLQKFFDEIFSHSHEMVQSSMRLSNGIYILDNQYSNRHCKVIDKSNETPVAPSAGLKEVLEVYGKNFKEMFKGLKTLNLDTGQFHTKEKSSTSLISEENKTNHGSEERKSTPEPPAQEETDDSEIVANSSSRKQTISAVQLENSISEEEKIVRSLYLIYKSSKISNLNFLDRYSTLFDQYDTRRIIELLQKLELVMVENEDGSQSEARKDCVRMYFDYLNPEIIYELDEESQEFIRTSFILINEATDSPPRCEKCQFPLRPAQSLCRYPKIGAELLKYSWSRHGQEASFKIAHHVPNMLETICKFYIQERAIPKVVDFVVALGNDELLLKAADHYDIAAWRQTFDRFCDLLLDQKLCCLQCDHVNSVPHAFFDSSLFYTFNHIFATASNYLNGRVILELLLSYSDKIPNGALNKDIFLNCLINS